MRLITGFVLAAVLSTTAFGQVESLPPPVVHGSSFEIISNSRYSSHSGFTSSTGGRIAGVAESQGPQNQRLEVARTKDGARLKIQLAEAATAKLVIYDMAGRPVRNWGEVKLPAGVFSFEWDGSDYSGRSLSAGPYFCRLALGPAQTRVLAARIDLVR